ncbi:hypothetical protein SERLA73DRAFT_33519, partial [Serpula lacrymans var. lacrymans S7.3]
GHLHCVHTPLISWITNLPEQLLISCMSVKHSPISTSNSRHFGNPTPQPICSQELTLNTIEKVCSLVNANKINLFHKKCKTMHLNGVTEPFWRDWGMADPSIFLTPDALHNWHKFYYDHVLKWVINIIGGPELDLRLSALQPRVGVHHWSQGISQIKQCTGREHCELKKVLIAVSAGAVSNDALCALRAITDFIFLAQSLLHTGKIMHTMNEALRQFYHYKGSIFQAGGQRGAKKNLLKHFEIPKLELMHHVEWSIKLLGAPFQWTSDITERCHITLVKTPYRGSNHRDFHGQCCRFLDRQEKQCFFQLYTTLKENG